MTHSKNSKCSILYAACLLSTLFALNTCLHIEYWNSRAGGFLPRTDYGHANPKWRVAASKSVRKYYLRQLALEDEIRIVENGGKISEEEHEALQSDSRPLTKEQQAELDALLAKSDINGTLRGWVESAGLVQYLVAPFALMTAVFSLFVTKPLTARLGFAGLAALSGFTIAMMWHREYFRSLGW